MAWERIPRLFFGCSFGLVLLISMTCLDVANAFSLPHPLAVHKVRRPGTGANRHLERIPLFAAIPYYATDAPKKKKNNNNKQARNEDNPAFLIESISRVPNVREATYKSIADLCIDVFFRELLDPSGKGNVNLLKAWQINYLKNLQTADLQRRRSRCPDTNVMFLAYEVRKTSGAKEALQKPLLMDDELEGAYNLPTSTSNINSKPKADPLGLQEETCSYVRGDLLGFVEVTQRSYGLGLTVDSPSLLETLKDPQAKRPVLTNLAVGKESRKYGIGSKLLEKCEEHVLEEWGMNEMILEVEDYNGKGLEFYQKRGYQVLFSDPASRRYDIQGFWLNKVRCRRDIMRKSLDRMPTANLMKSADSLFRKFRDTVGSF